MRFENNHNWIGAAVAQCADDVSEYGAIAKRERELGPAHPPALTRGGDDRGNHVGPSGNDRRRSPVAWQIALPIAGAMPMIGVSPAPADGKSLRSSSTISIIGA